MLKKCLRSGVIFTLAAEPSPHRYLFAMRFQGKVFLAFALLLVLVVGLLLFTSFRFERSVLLRVEGGLQDIVNSVNVATHEISVHDPHNIETLKDFMERCVDVEGVEKVSIINNHERIILSTDSASIGQRVPLPGDEEIQVVQRHPAPSGRDWNVRYDLRVPIIRGGKVIGAVWMVVAMEDFKLLFRDLYVKTLLIASAGLLLAFAASFLILHRLGRPLRALSQASQRISDGDLAVRVAATTGDEFKGVGRAFNAMVSQLEEKKQLEERLGALERHALLAEMAAHLAHEIRNPLNLIHLTVDQWMHEMRVAAEKGGGANSTAGYDMPASIKEATRHLDTVLQRFLELGKPDRLNRSELSLADLAHDMKLLLGQRLQERSIALDIHIPQGLTLVGDREQMRLLLLNLSLNAVAMSPAGGRIAITASASSNSRAGSVILTVSDDGPGIPASDLERIFEPYFTKREGGTGLGLALVRRIAGEHGGTVIAGNRPEGGALFTITLPQATFTEAA